MRIIAGDLKGREITVPRGSRIRPATGMVRETVMNLFTASRLVRGPFLDLCAGSGLVGFEALSRGAPRVVFVEADGATAGNLRRAVEHLGMAARCTVFRQDVRRCFSALGKCLGEERAACAFLDPPYISGMTMDLLMHVAQHTSVLTPDATLIVRTPDKLTEQVGGLRLSEHRQCGNAELWCYTPCDRGGDPT